VGSFLWHGMSESEGESIPISDETPLLQKNPLFGDSSEIEKDQKIISAPFSTPVVNAQVSCMTVFRNNKTLSLRC
jgi:hypothetical protein